MSNYLPPPPKKKFHSWSLSFPNPLVIPHAVVITSGHLSHSSNYLWSPPHTVVITSGPSLKLVITSGHPHKVVITSGQPHKVVIISGHPSTSSAYFCWSSQSSDYL